MNIREKNGLTMAPGFTKKLPTASPERVWSNTEAASVFLQRLLFGLSSDLADSVRKIAKFWPWRSPDEPLITNLRLSYFIELLKVDSDELRRFYEVQTLKSNWDVRDLKRAV